MIIPLDDHKSRLDEEVVEMVIFGVQVHIDGATTLDTGHYDIRPNDI